MCVCRVLQLYLLEGTLPWQRRILAIHTRVIFLGAGAVQCGNAHARVYDDSCQAPWTCWVYSQTGVIRKQDLGRLATFLSHFLGISYFYIEHAHALHSACDAFMRFLIRERRIAWPLS